MSHRTLRLRADPAHPEQWGSAIEQAASILRAGGTVAFATETVYGLGAHALDTSAVAKIFAAKQRPAWDPLIVHIADKTQLTTLTEAVPEPAQLWMNRFSPGPLTLLLPRSPRVPDAVTAGRSRVGVRIPEHPVAQALLRAAGIPVAAPSANLFGHVSPTTAEHVLADLDGRIDAVLDGGPCRHGLESTVVDACEDPCIVYRPGAVSLAKLAEVWPRVELYRPLPGPAAPREALPSPGVGLRHYAPRATLRLVEHGPDQAQSFMQMANENTDKSIGILLPGGLLTPEQQADLPANVVVFDWGKWTHPETLAHTLFAGLRALDARGVEIILCPLPAPEGLGAALRDRLEKAARAV